MTAPLTCTLVIEWDNQRLAETARARALLDALAAQIPALFAPREGDGAEDAWLRRLQPPLEVLVAYDPDEVEAATLHAFVARSLPGDDARYTLRWLPVPGATYYALKNAGARHAQGEVLFFVDSDLIPEPGWLVNLASALADSDAPLVGGHTFIQPKSAVEKAFAVAWLFQPRYPDGPKFPHWTFNANNFATRRAFFLAHPFPEEPWRSRGACVNLAKQLQAEGIPIFRVPTARAHHPLPNGFAHALARGLHHGRDALREVAPTGAWPAILWHAGYRSAYRIAWAFRNVLRDGRRVGLRWHELPVALAVMAGYHALFGPGLIWARFWPDAFERRVRM